MTFSLFCLIGEPCVLANVGVVFEQLAAYFSDETGVELAFEEDPFDTSEKNVILQWDGWWARFFYESGDLVLSDSREIAAIGGANAPEMIESVDRRLRVLLADDDSKRYTNLAVFVVEFLESVPGLLIFDAQAGDFVN